MAIHAISVPICPVHNQLALQISVARNIDTGVRLEKVSRSEVDLMNFDRHHGPVLHTWIVRKTKDRPHDNIIILNVVTTRNRISYTAYFVAALHRVAATGVELVILVLSNPYVMLSECSPLRLDGFWIGQ